MEQPIERIEINEVFKTNFSIYDKFERKIKLDQIAKLNYIFTIAKQLEKKIAGLNLLDFIPTNELGIMELSNGEINKALIDLDESKLIAPEIEIIPFTEIDKLNIKKAFDDMALERVATINSKIERIKRDVLSRQRTNEQSLADANVLYQSRSTITAGNSEESIEALSSIQNKGDWEFISSSNTYISFRATNPIVLTWEDYRVDFGKLNLKFKVTSAGLQVFVDPGVDALFVRDYYHPHISSDGHVCSGNMQELLSDAISQNNFKDISDIVMKLLTNYNPDSPYTNLQSFVSICGQMQPTGCLKERGTHYENIVCHECDHENEIECIDGYGESDCYECETSLYYEE